MMGRSKGRNREWPLNMLTLCQRFLVLGNIPIVLGKKVGFLQLYCQIGSKCPFSLASFKPRPVPEFLVLTRCAACYDQKGHSMPRRRADSETSSEGSAQELDWDSDTSSSCSSEEATGSEADQEDVPGSPAPGSGGPTEADCESASETMDRAGQEETRAVGREAQGRQEETKGEARNRDVGDMKTTLLLSKIPSSGHLRRPPSVISTLHLQALPSHHDGVMVYTQAEFSCPE